MARNLLTLFDFQKGEIDELFERAAWIKARLKKGEEYQPLKGKCLGMVFEKSSTRTRVSFEVGVYQLGGHALNLTSQASQLGRGETYEDTAQVLSRYVDGIMMRTFEQVRIEKMAAGATVPIINGLTDLVHPCQVLADVFTVIEDKGSITDQKIAYVGDGNNMANSWINAAIIMGFELRLACPEGFDPPAMILDKISSDGHANIKLYKDAKEAVAGVDVINTDTWISMGQEGPEEKAKMELFKPFQVNDELVALADKDSIVLHCLPAHRGHEITDSVMDGPHSRVFDEAENRLHVQKAIMDKLMA